MRRDKKSAMVIFRAGVPADLPVLAQYWRAMLVECGLAGSGFVTGWAERLQEQFAADMEAQSGIWFLAEDEGSILGTCTVFRQTGRSSILLDTTAMLAGMYVPPEFRGRGIARELLRRALDWCREHGVTTVRLNASPMGRPLYESFGFVPAPEMMRLDL